MMLYRFGRARLDLESRQLLCDGEERSLGPKAFDLLRLLIEFRPRVLTKAEIMDLIWPDAFVAEANVAILIGDIRAAIGDTTVSARLIKTHHGVGYSFCGEVVEQQRDAVVPMGGSRFLLAIGTRRVLLARGELIAGRDAHCDVIIPDISVSRRHAALHVTPSTVEIEDLESKNGTRVNDHAITGRCRLADGTVVTLGNVLASFHVLNEDGKSTLTVEA